MNANGPSATTVKNSRWSTANAINARKKGGKMRPSITAEIEKYCPQCVGARPERPKNQNLLNPRVSVPEICPGHQAKNAQLKAEGIAKGKVEVRKILPGVSGRDKKDHQKSLLNITGRKYTKNSRSKNQPP